MSSEEKREDENGGGGEDNQPAQQQQQQQQQQQRRGLGWLKKDPKATTTTATEQDGFTARRSNRVHSKYSQSDGDTWQETLAVCEVKDNKLVIRSYYTNTRTGQRAWDEPPSGASTVLPATEEMHKMANIQLLEMQIVTGHVPDSNGTAAEVDQQDKSKKKKGGFFRRKNKEDSKQSGESRKIQYKPDSFLATSKSSKGGPKQRDESLDPQLQQAIALSMRETAAAGSDPDAIVGWDDEPIIRSEITYRDDEEALAMVMALSLSEAEANSKPGTAKHAAAVSIEQDEVFQRAMEESKINMAAKAPPPEEEDLLGLADSPSEQDRKMPAKTDSMEGSDDWMNQKMPAMYIDKLRGEQIEDMASTEEEMLQQALEASRNEAAPNAAAAEAGSLAKMSPKSVRKHGGVKGLVRRLSSNKGLKEDAGVV